jgi:predicted hotdog family 3-hydroxylacyl-ACP dehydratase
VLIDAAGITRLIPHAGAMCLLDAVLSFDAVRIRCIATSHRATDNPLRRDGRLGILCGVEYAAQAMAVHAAVSADPANRGAVPPIRGFLASVRAVQFHTDRLDDRMGRLLIKADRLYGEAGRAIYSFSLRHDGSVLLTGRAAVAVPGE